VAINSPHALARAQEFADDGADQRKTEAHVKARENPRQRRGDHHARSSAIAGPQDAGIGDQVLVGLGTPGRHLQIHEEHHTTAARRFSRRRRGQVLR